MGNEPDLIVGLLLFLCQCLFFCGIPIGLLAVGYFAGTHYEQKHYRELEERERAMAHFVVTEIRKFPGGPDTTQAPFLVTAESVISTDAMKTFLAKFRNIIGGEVRSFETLLERARREALLRMIETAHHYGCNALCNVRLETVDISSMKGGGGKQGIVAVGVLASATAYRIRSENDPGTPPR